jgi:hypothetical protein
MTVRRRGMAMAATAAVIGVAACSSGGHASASFSGVLCPTVEAWSDQSVGIVNSFSDRSPGAATVAQRRQYYQDAFTGLGAQLDDLETRVDKLPRPPASADAGAVHDALEQALTEMRASLADVKAQATALPDSAYAVASVTDGHLFAGLEKNQAIVYQALSDLSEKYGTDVVPRGCGRRGAVDLSPPVTAPRQP